MKAFSTAWHQAQCRIRRKELQNYERMLRPKPTTTLQIVRQDGREEAFEIPTTAWRRFCTVADARGEDPRLWLARLLQIGESDEIDLRDMIAWVFTSPFATA
jgi:hypothetical protein